MGYRVGEVVWVGLGCFGVGMFWDWGGIYFEFRVVLLLVVRLVPSAIYVIDEHSCRLQKIEDHGNFKSLVPVLTNNNFDTFLQTNLVQTILGGISP